MIAVMMFCLRFITLLCCCVPCFTAVVQQSNAEDGTNVTVISTRLTRSISPHMAEWIEHVYLNKRATYNDKSRTWPNIIPYVIDVSYTGNQVTLREVMDHISSRVCITFKNVTSTYDPENPTWFTSNGFETNSYMLIKTTDGCATSNGQGNKPKGRVVTACDGFGINLHEILHSLGVIHSHSSPLRDSYVSIHTSLIKPELLGAYEKIPEQPTLDARYFDPYSIMMYTTATWHLTGQETYTPLRDDFVNRLPAFSEEHVVFSELSRIYKCNEQFCNNDQTDCGPGYHTLINGRCRCVCPEEWDHNTNCREHINGPTKNLSWPDTQIVLYGSEQCPTGFDPSPATLPITGTYAPTQEPLPNNYTIEDKTINILGCKKSTPVNKADVNWKTWPMGGEYCIVKPRGQDCGGVFQEGGIEFMSLNQNRPEGDVGDVSIDGSMLRIKYCCRDKENQAMVIDLPNAEPFKLVPKYQGCPMVRGMKSTYSKLTLWTTNSSAFGAVPPVGFYFRTSFLHYMCHYQPPIYGCSQVVNLNSKNLAVTIKTPGFGTQREPDRRCFYNFNVPAGSKLRLTLNTFDPHVNDLFLVKRFHKWQDPVMINNNFKPYQLVSEGDYLSLEYWSSWETTTNMGINFKVDVVLVENMCYDVNTRGADYYGDRSYTETFEPCVPWEKATSCDDFPFDGLSGISLLESGSSCRNPNGALLQPWCYTFVNGTVCQRRYCDVCNLLNAVDVLSNCSALKKNDSDFCKSAVERYGCLSTCSLSKLKFKPATCSPPKLPPDVSAAGGLKSGYKEGEIINVTCTTSGAFVNIIRCTKSGWSGQASDCSAAFSCGDKIQSCKTILTKFPEFCTYSSSKISALTFCEKSCGGCSDKIHCNEPAGKNYSRSSQSAVISPGQVMTFACHDGFYHVGGDLSRACSTSGTLLGSEPVCRTTPLPVDIQLGNIRNRRESLPKEIAFLLDDAKYRIPFNGKITKWYYYCEKAGPLNLIVFRPSGSSFKHVGTNSFTCEPGWRRTYKVPVESQVMVQKNDVFGAFSLNPDTLSVSDCNNAVVKLLVIPTQAVTSLTALQATTKFQDIKCLIPSLGVRLEHS
ncbi:uncharacterized protein LOC131935676 [Physella acuta]|uniref:uncharacterized protein LOC131935676 n=1 Tax=Physella acuta TaxID=109671 RepID=UPI0027DE3E01|nr:uncharacterized protein LOC131935676 [Physella acuta]